MWDLLEGKSLFHPAGEGGEYDAHVHLAQLASVLGPPPKFLAKREQLYRTVKLDFELVNRQGKKCNTVNDFWGGPFFDQDGGLIRRDLIKGGMGLHSTVTELVGEDKEEFLDFALCMLHWLPDGRKTAKELLQHRFFDKKGGRDPRSNGYMDFVE